MKKTSQEKQQLIIAKSNFKELKKDPLKFKESLLQIMEAFNKASIPEWGSLVFNGKRIQL